MALYPRCKYRDLVEIEKFSGNVYTLEDGHRIEYCDEGMGNDEEGNSWRLITDESGEVQGWAPAEKCAPPYYPPPR